MRQALALALVVLAPEWGLADQEWGRLYREGVTAFRAGDDDVAVQRFQAALQAPNAPADRGRRVRYVSLQFDEYMPEYYLAVIYARQGRYQDAVRLADQALAYVGQADPFHPSLVDARDTARKALTPTTVPPATTSVPASTSVASSTSSTTTSVPPTTIPGSTTSSVDPDVQEFESLMAQADRLRRSRDYAGARRTAQQARALGVDAGRVDAFLRQLDALVAAASRQTFERSGLESFYRGDYLTALAVLEEAAPDQVTPRMLFYMACSHAALALLAGDEASSRLDTARQLFGRVRQGQAALALDRRYVSPRVLDLLEGRPPLH